MNVDDCNLFINTQKTVNRLDEREENKQNDEK